MNDDRFNGELKMNILSRLRLCFETASANRKNPWSCASIPPYVFMA